MYNVRALPYSPVTLAASFVGFLALVYLGLIAVVMNYAASTVAFSQSVRNSEAAVAALEARYLSKISEITNVDTSSLGYEKPAEKRFVSGARPTAIR
jgi:acyl-CoA synthetase (AMP-forming)/AMP-acid ligase II